MKNLLKLASALALSCTFLAAHAQQGGGKMMKKDDKMADGNMMPKDKMHTGKMHSGNAQRQNGEAGQDERRQNDAEGQDVGPRPRPAWPLGAAAPTNCGSRRAGRFFAR